MPLGTEVVLRPGDLVFDGDLIPPQKGAQQPPSLISPCLFRPSQMAGWIRIPLGMKEGLGRGDIVLDGDSAPPRKGAQQLPFSAHIYVAKWLSISATAELLFIMLHMSNSPFSASTWFHNRNDV